MKHRISWRAAQRERGDALREWLVDSNCLEQNFDELAESLLELLKSQIRSKEDAKSVWKAVPNVLARCNEQETYELAGAPHAYAWLHLLDRYVRTWQALIKLLEYHALPMAKDGVNILDVGTGPGPSGFAICDFYNSLTEFADVTSDSRFRQPPRVSCVEYDAGTNSFRHILAQVLYSTFRQNTSPEHSVLAMCSARSDFGEIKPLQERVQSHRRLKDEGYEYFNEVHQCWDYDFQYNPEEVNDMVQSMHRYKFYVFSNFLTTVGTVQKFEQNLLELLKDASAGSVILVIGGKGKQYPQIYKYVDQLASETGFDCMLEGIEVGSARSAVSDRVYEVGAQFHEHLYKLSKDNSTETKPVREYFTTGRKEMPASHIRAYRKPGKRG